MDPIEDIENDSGLSRQWMGGSGDANATIAHRGDTAKLCRSSGEVEREFFELLRFVVRDELIGVDGKAGGTPIEQLVHEGFGETLGTVQTLEK